MSTDHQTFREQVVAHDRQLDRRLRQLNRHMSVTRYRALKLLLAFALLPFGAFVILEGGEPTTMGSLVVVAAAGLAGLELVELVSVYADGVAAQTQDHEEK